MDSKNIKSILQDALEDKVPASEINLLPSVQSRLVAGKQSSFQQGENMLRIKIKRLAFSALAMIAILAVALITPQGRAFAQSLLQFFSRSESDTLPLQPWQATILDDTAEIDPTALPPMPLITVVSDAERLAGFDAAELSSTPQEFTFLGARLYGKALSLEYEANGGGGNLIIMQSQDGYVQSEWDKAPANAIIPVKIGDLDGEFVQGTFVVYPNDTSAKWNPDAAILRLRWIKDGLWFEMAKFGDVESIEYLDQAGMIELAKNMAYTPAEVNTNPYPFSMDEVTQLAGYDLLVPDGATIERFPFKGATFEHQNDMASLFYANEAGEGFMLSEQMLKSPEDIYPLQGVVGASAPVDEIKVGSFSGEYVEGVWELTENGPVWQDIPFLKTLRWKTDNLFIEIVYQGMELTKEDLIKLAESMK
jgi:hypothetical protein